MNATNQSLSSSKDLCFHWHAIIHDDYAALDYFSTVLATTISLLTCPIVILLNALVITAVKTKRRLQTVHNILLACMAITDLVVGIAAQPAFITLEIIVLDGHDSGASFLACRLFNMMKISVLCLCLVSVLHLVVISVERFVAMKYPLRYDSMVTTFRLIVAVACCWFIVAIYFVLRTVKLRVFPSFTIIIVSFLAIFSCHTSVYFICCHHQIQIRSEQVSQEATAKFLKEKKACKTTSIIIGGVFICYFPGFVIAIVPELFTEFLIHRLRVSLRPIILSFSLINSLCNPIIYCWRNKEIRIASIKLLRNPASGGSN